MTTYLEGHRVTRLMGYILTGKHAIGGIDGGGSKDPVRLSEASMTLEDLNEVGGVPGEGWAG